MTLKQAIQKFDEEYKNTLPEELKIEWINLLDSTVYNDIILTHQNKDTVSFSGYSTTTPHQTVLLIPDPFSDIYIRFLAMKTDLYYSDISKFNNSVILYNSAYIKYQNYYNRKHLPIKNVEYFNA